MCPACGEPLRPDYGEAVEAMVGRDRVYTVHAGDCAAKLWSALTELGEWP